MLPNLNQGMVEKEGRREGGRRKGVPETHDES